MNIVEQEFMDIGLVEMRPNGKWFVMSKKNSIDFVIACKKEGIIILGIDAFYLRENGIQPSMENSIDYTSPKNKDIKNAYSGLYGRLYNRN